MTSKKEAAATTETTTDLVPVEQGGFVVLVDNEAKELLAEAAPGPRDLAKLLVPAGSGGAFFTIQTIEGEEAVKSLDVIIAYESPMERSFYATSIDDSDGGPPHCTSGDGVTGFGVRDVEAIRAQGADGLEPTEQACASCVFSKFASDLGGGKGQACSQRKRLVVFDRENILPMVLQVPAASLKALKSYKLLLVNARQRATRVVTTISLAKQKGSPDYYTVEFDFVRALSAGEVNGLAGLAQILTEAAGTE